MLINITNLKSMNKIKFDDLALEIRIKIFKYTLKSDNLNAIVKKILILASLNKFYRNILILDNSYYLLHNLIKNYCKNNRNINTVRELLNIALDFKNSVEYLNLLKNLILSYKNFYIDFDSKICDKNKYILIQILKNKNLSLLELIYDFINDKNIIKNFFNEYLKIAVENNYIELAEFLIMHDADINKKDFSDYPHLINATYKNNKDMVIFLLKKGAKVDAQNRYGKTALIIATENNYKEIVEILLNNGANHNLEDLFGNTALKYAHKLKLYDILKILE